MSTYHIELHTYRQFKKYTDPFFTDWFKINMSLHIIKYKNIFYCDTFKSGLLCVMKQVCLCIKLLSDHFTSNNSTFEVNEAFRVNITIVYEHTVCATSAFSMCRLRVVFNVVLF